MKITIESTTKVVTLPGKVLVRVWEGATSDGLAVQVMVAGLATERTVDLARLEEGLRANRAPSPQFFDQPAAMVL